ncbi:MAG: hypothetical protein R2712_02600 [Vicinamibacterales bacterium]
MAPLMGYRVFTTAFDRVVQAAALASPDELAQPGVSLDADFLAAARRRGAHGQAPDAGAPRPSGARVALRPRRRAAGAAAHACG